MNLYVEQHIFTFSDKFSIYDENKNPKYFVVKKIETIFSRQFEITSEYDNKLLGTIDFTNINFFPIFKVDLYELGKFTVEKNFSFIIDNFSIKDLDWEVLGKSLNYSFEVVDKDSIIIGTVSKALFSLSDYYEIKIENPLYELHMLAITLIIDAANAMKQNQ